MADSRPSTTDAATASHSAGRRGLWHSSSFRITLAFSVLSATLLTLLLAVVYWFSVGYLERQTEATIESDIAGLAEHYRRSGLRGLDRVINERIWNDRSRRGYYLFTDAQLKPLAGNLGYWPDPQPIGDNWLTFDDHGNPVRARFFRVGNGYGLLVGRDVHELQQFERLLRQAMLLGLAATIALSIGGGAILSARLLRRVEAINRTARRISDGELALRMPISGSSDEFDELAAHLNDMLARIEALLGSVRHVGDNIAHDLRTPLTRLRTRLEGLRSGPTEGLRDGIELAIEDADQLLTTFQALLRIARLRSGSYVTAFGQTAIDELARDAIELYQAVADEAGIRLHAHLRSASYCLVDRDLLFQALCNLLDNALKYTPSGGNIHVTVGAAATPPGTPASHFDITVADDGPGIPENHYEQVLEPFFRVDAARTAPGNGLGLSLVKAIADLHRAELKLTAVTPGAARPGLAVRMRLPVGQVAPVDEPTTGPAISPGPTMPAAAVPS